MPSPYLKDYRTSHSNNNFSVNVMSLNLSENGMFDVVERMVVCMAIDQIFGEFCQKFHEAKYASLPIWEHLRLLLL